MKIEILKSYFVNGKIQKLNYTSNIEDLNKYFDNAIKDAQFFARTRMGVIGIQRTEKTLYLDYSDIPNTTHIDTVIITI
jgi:hypothetical protein